MRTATFLLAVVTSACAGRSSSPPGVDPDRKPAALGAPAWGGAIPSFEPGPPARPTPFTGDPLWQRSARGDVIDLTELADREGAGGLLAGAELGGTVGLTALSALPHAEDAEIALGPLCNLATRMPLERVAPVLAAIQSILRRPPRPTERLDAEGLLVCRAGLPRLETSAGLVAADRDRVGNSRALLEEWLNAR